MQRFNYFICFPEITHLSYVASFRIFGSKYPATSRADGPLVVKSHSHQKYWKMVKVELIKSYANIQQKLMLMPDSVNTQLELSAARCCASRYKYIPWGFCRPQHGIQMEVFI